MIILPSTKPTVTLRLRLTYKQVDKMTSVLKAISKVVKKGDTTAKIVKRFLAKPSTLAPFVAAAVDLVRLIAENVKVVDIYVPEPIVIGPCFKKNRETGITTN